MSDSEAQNSRQKAGAAVGAKSGNEEGAEASRLKKQIKFYASELNVNRNIDQLYYNTNEEEQEVRKEEAQIAEQEMRVDESAGILTSGKVVHDQGDDLVVLGHRDSQRNPLANYVRDQRGPESAQEGKARLNFGYFAKISEATPGANRVPSNTKQKKQMAPSEILNMTKDRKAKVAQEPRASLARSQLAQQRDSFKDGDMVIKSQRQVAHRPSTDNMIIGRADLPNNGNIAGQYLVQGDGGLAGYNRQAAGDQEPLVDSRNHPDATAPRQPKGRPSNALQTRSERYSRKEPLVDKKSLRQQVGNFYELHSNQRPQAKKRVINQHILDGPYTDNVEIKNGNHTQKGLGNAHLDLTEDYSNFEVMNQVLANAGQHELGGTQKIANLNRYLADEQTVSSGAGVAYANTAMMGNTTSSLMLKSSSDHQQQYPFQDTLHIAKERISRSLRPRRNSASAHKSSPFRSPRSQILTNNMTTLNMDAKFGNIMQNPPQKPSNGSNAPFSRQQFNIQNGKRVSLGQKQAKMTSGSGQNRQAQQLKQEEPGKEGAAAEFHSRAQYQHLQHVNQSFQDHANSTLNSGAGGVVNVARNEKMEQISGHPYRVIKYNNVSFQKPAKAKFFHEANEEGSVYNPGKHEQQQYLVNLGRSSEMQGQLLKFSSQNAHRGESKASSALSHMSQNLNAEKVQLNAIVMKQPSSSCSKTQMGSLTDKRKYRAKVPQQQKSVQNQGRVPKGANIVPISHHKPNMSHHHSNSSNFSNQNFLDKNLTMNIYQSGFALKNIAGSATSGQEGGPTLINMAITQKAIQNQTDEVDAAKEVKLFGGKQQNAGVHSLKNMDFDLQSRTKVASLDPNSSISGGQRSLLDKTSLLAAPATNAYVSNLTSFNRIQSMSSKQAKLSAKAQQQMPLKSKKSTYNPMLVKQSTSKDQAKNATAPPGALVNAKNLASHTPGIQPAAGPRHEDGGSSVPSGSLQWQGGISFNSSQHLRGNFYQTQVLKSNSGGEQATSLATGGGRDGTGEERPIEGEKAQIRLSESQGPIGMVQLDANEGKGVHFDHKIEMPQKARAKSKEGQTLATGAKLSQQMKKVLPMNKPQQAPEDYGQRQGANKHLLANGSYSNEQQKVLMMANTQGQRTNSLEDVAQRNQGVKVQNQQLSLMNQKQLKIQKNHIIYKAPPAAIGNQYTDIGDTPGLQSGQVTHASKSSLNERSREGPSKQKQSPRSQSQFYLNLLQIQKPTASAFNQTQNAALMKKNRDSPQSQNNQDRAKLLRPRYDEYDFYDYSNSFHRNEATVESKAEIVIAKSNNTNRGALERSGTHTANGKSRLQSDRYKSNRSKADVATQGLGQAQNATQNLLRQVDPFEFKNQPTPGSKMLVYNAKPNDEESLEDFRYGMASTQLSHLQSRGGQADQLKRHVYGRPYAHSQLARSSVGQRRQQSRQTRGAKIKADHQNNQPHGILLNVTNAESQQNLRGDGDALVQYSKQAATGEGALHQAVLFEAHNQNLLNILIKEPQPAENSTADGGKSGPEKEARPRPQLKRLPKNAAAMNSDVQKHHLPGNGQAEEGLVCTENEMMNATAPINMRQIQPDDCSSRNQTELVKRSSIPEEHHQLQEEPVVMNAGLHQRQESGVSSSVVMQKKSQRSQVTKGPAGAKQVSHVSRRSQNHLKSDDSRAGDAEGSYPNCKESALFDKQIQSQGKISQMHLKSKTKVNTQNIASPMDYTINEPFCPGSSDRPVDGKVIKKGNSSSQNTINHDFVHAGRLERLQRGQLVAHQYPQKKGKGKLRQEARANNASNAVVHTGNSGASRKLILADDERNSQGFTGQEDFQVSYTKHVVRPGMSQTAAISNMAGNQLNTPSSDEDEIYGSLGKESGPQEELRVDETLAELADDDQQLPFFMKDNNLESQEKLGILDEDINHQIELLDQLQQLNSLDQSMLNEEQIQQFNELLQIKKDLERSIWDKERKQSMEDENRMIKDFELNSTQGMATRMMLQMQQQQEEAQLLDRLRGSDFSGAEHQNCNAIQVGGVSVEIEEAGTILDSANFADQAPGTSNMHSFINTGNLTNYQQYQTTGPDGGHRHGASTKRKRSQRPTPQCQEAVKRPAKASKSQTAIKTRGRTGTQAPRDNQQVQSNKMMSTYMNQGRNATAQQQLPGSAPGLEVLGPVQDGLYTAETFHHPEPESLADPGNKAGAFLPNNMSIRKNAQINKKAEVSSSFTGGSRSKSSVNYLKLMKTTSHISTGIHKGQEMATAHAMPMKQAPVVQVPSQFNLNQTQPISKMKLNEHGLDAGSLIADRKGQLASCSGQIVGAEHQIHDDDQQSRPNVVLEHQDDRPYQENHDEQDLEENEDMDIDLILGHYEYQNFTDQLIDSNTHQDEVEQDAINYFKIQSENEILANTHNQMASFRQELVADQSRHLNDEDQRSRRKQSKEPRISVAKLGAAQNQQLAKSKRSQFNSKRLSSQMGDDYGKGNSQGQQSYSHQRPSSQADVSMPSAYHKNLMALHWQLADADQQHQRPYDQKTKVKEGIGSEKKARGLGGQSQNNFATSNVTMINSQVDAKKKAQNFKGQAQQKLAQQKMVQGAKPQAPNTMNVSGQVPSIPSMMSGIRNKFNKNFDQAAAAQAPAADPSLNKKKRSNSRQKQRSMGGTQSTFYPNAHVKQQKLSRNNNNEHLVVKRAQRGPEKQRKASLHSQGSQPGQTQLVKAVDPNAADIKAMLNESQKTGMAVMSAQDPADSVMQPVEGQLAPASRHQTPGMQPLTSSKMDLVKMVQKPQIVDQSHYDSQGNLVGQSMNRRTQAAKVVQRPLEQPHIMNAQINGKKVKIAKSMKQGGPQGVTRAVQQKKVGNMLQPRPRVSSTDNHNRAAPASQQLQDPANPEGNAQNYQKVMKTLMELCNQTQNIRNTMNDSYQDKMPNQIQLINDYSSQDNIDRMACQVTGEMVVGMDQPGQVAVSQSHHFKNVKQKMVAQGQARNATLSNSRRTSKVFLSQQSKEDMPVLGNMQQNLGSVDQNPGNNKHTLGSSTGTINYRGGAGARAESQICAQSRLQSQPMSKLQSGLTTQLLHDQQIWGGSHHQQVSKGKVVGRGAANKSPNQPHSLLNTSSNLHDFLRNNKLSIVSQNPNHGAGGGLGSTYAPGGLGFGQIRTLMKLPTFQSSQMNNPAKAVGNFAAHRVQKAAQATGGSYHPHHQSSGNHSSLLGTLKGGIGIMPNLSNAEFNNEHLNESLRDFEMALEHMAGSTGNMQHVLQKTTHQGHTVAGAIDSLRVGHDLTSTQHLAVANQMKLSGLVTHLQGWRAEAESGSGTITNIEAVHQDAESRSRQKARKADQLAQQMMSNLRIHKRKDAVAEKAQGVISDAQHLHENPLIRELFPEAKEEGEQPGVDYTEQDEDVIEQRGRRQDEVEEENGGYESDTDQSEQEQQNDGDYAKDQFYQVQKLQLQDANALDDLVEGQYQRADGSNELAYSRGLQVASSNWSQKNNKVNAGVKPKFRDQLNPSQRGSAVAKVGQVHLIPKQLVKAAKDQVQRTRPQIEGVDSEEHFRIRGFEDTQAKSNHGGRQIERLSSSGSTVKRSGPSKPNAPKASGTLLLKQNTKHSGPTVGAYSSGPAQEMIHGAQIIKNASNGQFNEAPKVSSSGGNYLISREGASSKPQRLSSGFQKESKPLYPTSKPIHALGNTSQDSIPQPDEIERGSNQQPSAKAIHANATSNVKRAKDEQPVQSHEQRSPLDSGSKLLKRAMRDIKLENNINLRESEKDISGGGSAASDVQSRQIEDEQSMESPDDSETDDSADGERPDTKPDDEQVYNDKYYEMNQEQNQDKSTSSKGREATNKRIQQLREDLDEKMRDRYLPNAPGGRLNERRQKTKNSGSEMSKQNSNNQILIDHNSAYNPSQIGDAEDGVAEQKNRVHNYQFGRQIGEGAYAVVRTATSREDNQKYAIKIYDKSKLSDINRQRSVRREVVLLQKMNHPNIVKLIEAFETDSHVYLVMENVTGGSLHSYLKEMINKQLDEEEARRIFQQILVALKYCHSKCIAHRDIKLENVLLDEAKNVKLIDFGFSTCIPNHKKIRMFCGTPSYMAPQIVSKVEYAGPPADIWATGVLLYALLNGCFPFRGQTDDDLYRRIKRGTYHIYNQRVTREYLDILQRCLDVNDDTRPSAKDLLDDSWFKITDIKQRAYEEEKRQFKAKILAKVPIIKKTNHTICILAQNPTDVLNKGGAKRQENGQAAQIQQEDEQKNIRSPPDGNATNATAMAPSQPYNQRRDEESPCMGQGLQGTQTRTGDSQTDQIQSSGGNNKQVNQNMQATVGVSAQSSSSNHQPYRNICDTQGPPVGDGGEATHLFNNGASDNSANGADYKDQVVMQQDPGKTQQQLTVGVYEGNLITGANLQAGKADGFPRTIILNQNQASLLGGPGLQAQDAGSASLLHQQQPPSSSGNQPGAIVLSYGAAMAPQIHVYQLKKKLNHEAYQAYYNTSSATGVTCAPGPNPALTRTNAAAAGPPHPLQGMSALGPLHLNVQSSPVAGAQNQTHHNNKMIN